MTNKLIDFYNTLSITQKERLMHHVDNITAKERSPRKEKKKQKKSKPRGAIRSPEGNTYYDH